MKLHREEIRGDIGLLGNRSERIYISLKRDEKVRIFFGAEQREYILPEARSGGIEVHMGQIRGNIYFLKPVQRVRSFMGGDQREYILPEAKSGGIKVHMGQIRGSIYFLKPDQRVRSFMGG
jgi:hypothetical protein